VGIVAPAFADQVPVMESVLQEYEFQLRVVMTMIATLAMFCAMIVFNSWADDRAKLRQAESLLEEASQHIPGTMHVTSF